MQVQVFNFDNHTVRTQTDERGDPWFNANDVCKALGFGNSRDAIERHVDQEDVGKRDTPTAGGVQAMNNINESGLYALIFGSTLPAAKAFKKWVTSEVLPTIRKTGKYEVVKAPAFEIPTTLSGALRLAAEQAETIEKQDAILLKQAPKMAVYELLADRKQDVSTTIVAKQLGTSAPKLNDFLREHGVKMMGADLPKAGHIQWFNVVSIIANGHECLQCLITPYGQIEITKLWHTHNIKNILQKVPKLL
jgi:prophage antirepressor-like protein